MCSHISHPSDAVLSGLTASRTSTAVCWCYNVLRITYDSGLCVLSSALDKTHVRRGFFDLHVATSSPTAKEALERIGQLYRIEEEIRGQSPEVRFAVRQASAVPLLNSLHSWMVQVRTEVENASELAKALDYALKESRWNALQRYTEDGHLEIDNNNAERSVRGAAVGKKNYLFFGSDSGGERAAIIYSLVETCKLNHIDPQRYLQYVIERIADHPINRVGELLPWNVADKLNQPEQVKQALAA